MSIFKLPDLGEGLQEAEIREWHVKVGDRVAIDQPLLAVETAKAVVEVPSPQAGVIKTLHGAVGDTMEVGKPLVEFEGDAVSAPSLAASSSSAEPVAVTDHGGARTGAITDTGTVVGAMQASNDVVAEKATTVGSSGVGLKVIPAVRALAHRLNVDLTIVTPTGPDGMITAADVQRVHKVLTDVGPIEKLKGPRKAMSRAMSQARDEVMPTTVTEDAVLHAWTTPQDLTVRLIRALVAGVKAQPALNAWYDQAEVGRRVLEKIHLGVAVDTPEGLFVAVLQDVASRTPESLRTGLAEDERSGQQPERAGRGTARLHDYPVELRPLRRQVRHPRDPATHGGDRCCRLHSRRRRAGQWPNRHCQGHAAIGDLRPSLRDRRRSDAVSGSNGG